MLKQQSEVTVIICAYTMARWKELQQAIKSVWAQSVMPYEIILVIDHNPALYALAREAFSGVRVIENQEERGLSGARNCGIVHSRGQLIAFMDEDATASPNWLETLIRSYNDPAVIGVGGEVKPNWESEPPAWLPEEFYWVVGCSYKGLPQESASIRNPIGCNMSFRRDALLESGGFRNDIGRIGTTPLGCEETELSIRIRQQNPSSVYMYQPDAFVLHKVPEWRATWKYFIQRCYAEGLSKAMVAHYVGSEDGLSSERRYVLQTLTKGVFNNIATAVKQAKPSRLLRAVAIIAGFAVTSIGYGIGLNQRPVNGIPTNGSSSEYATRPAGAIFIGAYQPSKKEEVQSETEPKR